MKIRIGTLIIVSFVLTALIFGAGLYIVISNNFLVIREKTEKLLWENISDTSSKLDFKLEKIIQSTDTLSNMYSKEYDELGSITQEQVEEIAQRYQPFETGMRTRYNYIKEKYNLKEININDEYFNVFLNKYTDINHETAKSIMVSENLENNLIAPKHNFDLLWSYFVTNKSVFVGYPFTAFRLVEGFENHDFTKSGYYQNALKQKKPVWSPTYKDSITK